MRDLLDSRAQQPKRCLRPTFRSTLNGAAPYARLNRSIFFGQEKPALAAPIPGREIRPTLTMSAVKAHPCPTIDESVFRLQVRPRYLTEVARAEHDKVVKPLAPERPISLSAYPFCYGERGDGSRSRIANDRILRMSASSQTPTPNHRCRSPFLAETDSTITMAMQDLARM